jgi:predicted KAP-like P-loop ATPase
LLAGESDLSEEPSELYSHKDDRLKLTGDRPKEHLADDRLGYARFAQSLARSIADLAPTEGIVLAVNGPWGSGKTSAVNMIVEALGALATERPEGGEILPIRFNPWWFSEQEDLVKAFFGELSAGFDKKLSEKVGEGFRKVARRIASSRDLVVAGLGLVPGGSLVKDVAGAAIGAVGGLAGSDKSLSQLRDELAADLRAQDKRLLVIIDDVDRLPASEVRQIFRLVKSVADLPNVIYLLIFDREIAERAFEDRGNDLGPKWHEKIVQAAFDLPPVQRIDIHQVFLDGLSKLMGAMELPDLTRWGNVFHDGIAPWLRTPRDAGRLLNALIVSWPAVARDVDLADFVALETLRLFEPSLHAFIRHNPHRLTGLARDMGYDRGAKESLGRDILEIVEPAGRERAKAALQRLFPKLESVWGNHRYASDFLACWDRERRVCAEKRFPAYFGFGIGGDVLAHDELEEFVANIADGNFVRAKVGEYVGVVRRTGGTKAAVLLEELAANVDLIEAGAVGHALVNLLDTADVFTNAEDARVKGFLDVPATWRLWFTLKPLLERLEAPDRAAALRTAFASAASLQGLGFALMVFRTSLGRDPDARSDAAGAPLVDDVTCDELEEALRGRFREAAANGKLLVGNGLIPNLHQWVKLGEEDAVKAWTDGILEDDAAILYLAKGATQITQSHAIGDRVIRQRPSVDRPGLERVVNVDRMIARLGAVAGAGPEVDAAGIIRAFNLGLKAEWPFASEEDDKA